MAKVRVMYWKEIPAQVQAVDDSGQVSQPLDDRFQQGIDAISMFDGSSGSDDYMMGWNWGDYSEVEGDAQQAAASAANGYDDGFPRDFVERIRDLHNAGRRDPTPGAVDHWVDDAKD